jgi:GTP-binding protein HflX
VAKHGAPERVTARRRRPVGQSCLSASSRASRAWRSKQIYEVRALENRKERAILIGVTPSSTVQDSLSELALLTQTAGALVAETLLQRRDSIHPGTFLSKGKLEQVQARTENGDVDMVIFDDDLTPAQVRSLETRFQKKVLDRSELILAIFAEHARTREARLQVELAQLEYLLPRLTRMWGHLSRQQGGIGTRGPGETQLEVDRRRVRTKIAFLKRKLAEVDKERRVQRARRYTLHRTALVGYTNAGKSTLMNALTGSAVLTEDKLFATLDATTRRLRLSGGEITLLSDTVGFIRKLPHHLVAAFRSTLQEVIEADLLVHVIDAASPVAREQIAEVNRVLGEMGATDRPRILALNKADIAEETDLVGLVASYRDAIVCSAERGEGLAELQEAIAIHTRAPRNGKPASLES